MMLNYVNFHAEFSKSGAGPWRRVQMLYQSAENPTRQASLLYPTKTLRPLQSNSPRSNLLNRFTWDHRRDSPPTVSKASSRYILAESRSIAPHGQKPPGFGHPGQ